MAFLNAGAVVIFVQPRPQDLSRRVVTGRSRSVTDVAVGGRTGYNYELLRTDGTVWATTRRYRSSHGSYGSYADTKHPSDSVWVSSTQTSTL